MIIKVEQTKSNLKNKFEIKVNNELKYLAGSPWMDMSVPLDIDKVRPCIITKTDETICYITSYNIIENIKNTVIPMKWVFTGEQKSIIYNIFDNENNICGKFYKLTNGFLNTKYVIEYGNYTLKSYDISVGKTRNILIYKDDLQIAEIIKPLSVSDNLDYYYIFLLDEYRNLETILSFFTIFFDYQIYSNSGQVVAHKEEVQIMHTYDKNNKFYDKNWISNHFSKEDVELINSQILQDRKNTTNSIKKQAKYIVAFVFILLLIGGIVAFVITGNTDNADEYKFGNDTIKSIEAVVEKTQVISLSTEVSNGVTTKTIRYKSDNVQKDLLKYIQYLRNEGGFSLTKDMDLNVIPSTVELAKTSSDTENLIIMTIDYNSFEYTITIQKKAKEL